MSKKSVALAIASAACIMAAPAAQAATVIDLGPSERCSASGCFGGDSRTFTQAFTPASGKVDISALRLFRGIVGDMQNHAVRISFTRADGTVVESWGAYTLAAIASGDFVTIGGPGFTWDSADGTLLLKLELLVPGKGGAGGFGGAGASLTAGGPIPTAASLAIAPVFAKGAPLVNGAGPNGGGNPLFATAVPEPGTWALMIGGFALAGARLRRRARLKSA